MGRAGRVVAWVLAWAVLAALPALAGVTQRADVDDTGLQADAPAFAVSVSGDGRFVAFASAASDLVPNDGGLTKDIFVFDRKTATIERISTAFFGGDPDGDSDSPVISADGRFVAFASDADDLIPNDINGLRDIFLVDRQANTIELLNSSAFGGQADGDSDFPSISADGRFAAFASAADNLVFDDTNLAIDVFLVDRTANTIELVSVTSDGVQGDDDSLFPSVSGDGSAVAFSSDADNLVANDANFARDVFVWERTSGRITLASVSSAGVVSDGASDFPSLNGDGSIVAFASAADNLVAGDTNARQDIFVHDLVSGFTTRESVSTAGVQANDDSSTPSLSANGRFVAFASLATNLVSNDTNAATDVFVRDRVTALTVRASVASNGTEADGDSFLPAITAAGAPAAFLSNADNLVPDDTNLVTDVFVHRWISFPDVPPEAMEFREVEAIVQAGVVQGFPDGLFHPEVVVTRDQMAVFIARALSGGEANVPAGPSTPTFPDVPTSFWAFRHIELLARLGVVKGQSDGTFGPFIGVDRAQMAAFMARAVAGGDASVPPGPAAATFPDVPTDFWAFKYVEFLASRGVVQGFPDGLYHPELFVNRGEMALFIERAFRFPEPGA